MNKYIKDIASKIINDKTGIFDDIYIKNMYIFLLKIDRHIQSYQKKYENMVINKENILISIGFSFKKFLINISCRTLIKELYEEKDSLIGNTSEERYNYFIKWFLKNRYEVVFNKSSIINSNIIKKSEFIIKNLDEIFERIQRDLSDIESLANFKLTELHNISINCGDSHNSGKTVAIITFNKYYRILYKPHSLATDIIFNKILKFFNNSNILKCSLRHIFTINKSTYGWQEYISTKECENMQHVINCTYRLGCLIFVAYLLNLTDLHLDNLFISGEYPYIIDTETMFYNFDLLQGMHVKKADGWTTLLKNSVFFSGLFPAHFEDVEENGNVDLSGLMGGHDNITTIQQLSILNAGTDMICFGKKNSKITRTNNAVRFNDNIIKLSDYIDNICQGFNDSYNILLRSKDDFLRFIEKIYLDTGCYRQVFRKTSLYDKYIMASYHPKYLKDHEALTNLFSKLKGRKFVSKLHEMLVTSEIEQLSNQDIPYFYTKYDSLDLFSVNGFRLKNFYTKTIKLQFKQKIHNLCQNDLLTQEYIIKCLLSDCPQNRYNDTRFKLPSKLFDNNINNSILSILNWIGNYINSYHYFNDSCKLYFNIIEGSSYKFGSVQPILYDGIGIDLLYIYMFHVYKNETYYNIASALTKKINNISSQLYDEKIEKYGVFDGFSSLLYLNYNAWTVFHEKEYLYKFNQLSNKLLSCDLKSYESFDIISGCSGIIIMALNIYENDKKQINAKNIAHKFGTKLYELFSNGKILNKTGFAHGYSGSAAAFMKLSLYEENDKYYKASMQLLLKENEYYNIENNNWNCGTAKDNLNMNAWCYGAVGILGARMIMLNYAKEEDKLIIEEDIKKCLIRISDSKYSSNVPDILCHGNAGNIDLLISYCKINSNYKYKNLLKQLMSEMIISLNKYGFRYTNTANVINISFMNGIAGLGYCLLHYLNPNIPSILLLESPINNNL